MLIMTSNGRSLRSRTSTDALPSQLSQMLYRGHLFALLCGLIKLPTQFKVVFHTLRSCSTWHYYIYATIHFVRFFNKMNGGSWLVGLDLRRYLGWHLRSHACRRCCWSAWVYGRRRTFASIARRCWVNRDGCTSAAAFPDRPFPPPSTVNCETCTYNSVSHI